MTVILRDKEESLRKSKELLRRSQQEEDSGEKMELDPISFEMSCDGQRGERWSCRLQSGRVRSFT